MPSIVVRLAVAFTLTCLCPAAELQWVGIPTDGRPPAPWRVLAGEGASVSFVERAIAITAPPGRQALAEAVLALPDGSDERPLRLSAVVSASGTDALTSYPAVLALAWQGGIFAVGLASGGKENPEQRLGWAGWSGKGGSATVRGRNNLLPGASPAHLRIVLTTSRVSAFVSSDGWEWQCVATAPRNNLAVGAPVRVVAGRGLVRAGAADLAADPPGAAKAAACSYRFADLRVEADAPEIPAALLHSYAKPDSPSDAFAAIEAAGQPRRWRVRGPDTVEGLAAVPVLLPAGFDAGVEWKPCDLGEGERFLPLGALLPGQGQLRWAATDLTVAKEGWYRFRFDGTGFSWLYVDGRLIAAAAEPAKEAELDRRSASAWLEPGSHTVVLAVHSSAISAGALRWEPGDPRQRIALLRRLAIDFPDDGLLAEAPFEIARLWEGLGFAREALAALAAPAAAEPAVAERARVMRLLLLYQLGDASFDAESAALRELWAGSEDQVTVAERMSEMWQEFNAPELAMGELALALALPGLDSRVRCRLAVDRARLCHARGDAGATAVELRAAAAHLAAGDALRFDLLCAAARLDPALAPEALAELTRSAADARQARRLVALHAARTDAVARLAARRLAVSLPAAALALPAVDLAEELRVAKDEAGALQVLVAELARRKLPAVGDVAAAHLALLRAVLAETPAGAAMLDAVATLTPSTIARPEWRVRGPVPSADWALHEQPPFDPARAPEGAEWRQVPREHWLDGVLDHARLGGGERVEWYAATIITSDAARVIEAGFAADEALSVWLNGERRYSERRQEAGLQRNRVLLPLALRPGANVLVCAVRNGSGPSALQVDLRRHPWPASELAAILAGAASGRHRELADLADGLLAVGRLEEAWALHRAVLACWRDSTSRHGSPLAPSIAMAVLRAAYLDTLIAMEWHAPAPPRWRLTPVALLELLAWFDAMQAEDRLNGESRQMLRDRLVTILLDAGLADEAQARVDRDLLLQLDPQELIAAQRDTINILTSLGDVTAALQAAQRALGSPLANGEARRWFERRSASLRHRARTGKVAVATSHAATVQLTAAESSDAGVAATAYQATIEDFPGEPVPLADGRLVGAAAHAAARLRSAPPAVREAWLEAYAGRAEAQLARAQNDAPAALAAVSCRWPLAPAAGEALQREAGLWAARGAWELAAGTAARCLAEHPELEPGRLLLRAAHASARLGDAAALDGLLARLGRLLVQPEWDGSRPTRERLAAALRQLLPVEAADPAPCTLRVDLPRAVAAQRPECTPEASAPLPAVVLAEGQLVVATADEIFGIAPEGGLRWRQAASRSLAPSAPAMPLSAESLLAIDQGVAVAGLRVGGLRRLVAVDLANGQRLWSSDQLAGLDALALASGPHASGGRVWARFAGAAGQAYVICLDLRTGSESWRSPFGRGAADLPILADGYSTIGPITTGCDGPAPVLRGRELFVADDAGRVGAFDAVDGRLIWLHLYQRADLDAQRERSSLRRLCARVRGSILVDAERVYLAPRDALGLRAINRADGVALWSVPSADAIELCAATPAGLVASGQGLTLLDPRTGALRWRWLPRSGERPGRPALCGDALWIPLQRGPCRIALADGSERPGPAWQALGLDAPAGGLIRSGGRLVAVSDGMVAVPQADPAKPVRLRLAGRVEPAVTPVPAANGPAAGITVAWQLPIGPVDATYDLGDGLMLAVADGRMLQVDVATGRIGWSAVAPAGRVRWLQYDREALLVVADNIIVLLDRATGAVRWTASLTGWAPQSFNWLRLYDFKVRLQAGLVLRWTQGSGQPVGVYDARDGRLRCEAVMPGETDAVVGASVAGEELRLLVIDHRRRTRIEVRSTTDGRRLRDPVPLDMDGGRDLLDLGGGDLLIGSPAGSLLWNPQRNQATRLDLAVDRFYPMYQDGDIRIIVGQKEGTVLAGFLDPAGRLLGTQTGTFPYDDHSWRNNRAFLPRVIGRLGLSSVVNVGKGLVEFSRANLDGSGRAVLADPVALHYGFRAIVPLAGRICLLANDPNGLRVRLVDPVSARVEAEAVLPMTMVPREMPVGHGGTVAIPTVRGLAGIVRADQAAKPASGAGRQPVPRLAGSLVLDGRCDEWPAQPPMVAADGRLSCRAGWQDRTIALAISIPMPPALATRTIVHLDVPHEGGGRPLLFALEWAGGAGRLRVLQPAESRWIVPEGQLAARAASDGSATTWELSVPWSWIAPSAVRCDPGQQLRLGVLVEPVVGELMRLGDGLHPALDPAALLRLELLPGANR